MKIVVAVFLSLLLPLDASIFNVRESGAASESHPIHKAVTACQPASGTMEFPARNYLSQPPKIYSQIIFQLDAGAALWMSTNQTDFMKTPGGWLMAKIGSDFAPFSNELPSVTVTAGEPFKLDNADVVGLNVR